MAKSIARQSLHNHANRFPRPTLIPRSCAWDDCRDPCIFDLPVCQMHALAIHGRINAALSASPASNAPAERAPVVYYLMIGPATVKIGHTGNLRQRVSNLRTDLQYVVAVEPGGRDVERDRHKQFSAERIGQREDFRLSDRLKTHIEALQPERDRLTSP